MDKQSHVVNSLKIFIYSPQLEISHIISDNLSETGNQCIVFESLENLSSLIRNMNKGPDLLVLDYLSYNHEMFNVYAYLKSINKVFPVVFYNDPCLTRTTRSAHWRALLEITQNEFIGEEETIYDDIFKALETLVESKEFSPYISLMQPPAKVPENLIKDKFTLQYMKDSSDDSIGSFRERNKLPANLFYLLSLLQKNKAIPLKTVKLKEFYENDGKRISEKSLRVLLSKLKSIIRADKECNFVINDDNGTYRFITCRK